MNYCPKCLDTSIRLEDKGVIHFIMNGKHQDTSQLLFSLENDNDKKIPGDFKNKIAEFMKWYSQFKNRSPIASIQVFTNNYYCKNKCAFSANLKFSIVDILIPAKEIVQIIKDTGKEYGIEVTLESEDIIV